MSRIVKAALLVFFFSLCGAAFLVTHRWRESVPPPAPQELYAVLTEQLAAFRAADYPGAYRQASTGVQQKFTLPQFEQMVRLSYGDLANAERVEFGTVQIEGSTAFVQVFVFSPGGSVRAFLYSLLAEDETWKVGGVQELQRYRATSRLNGTRI